MVEDKKVVIGSAHFVFEDEKCTVPAGEQEKFDALPVEYSHLYLAIGGEAGGCHLHRGPAPSGSMPRSMKALRALGIQQASVMLTGDSERTAAAIAAEVGVDDYRAEVLPEDKANFVEQEQRGRPYRHHARGRHQRFSGAVRGQRWHRHQRRRSHRP